MGKYFQTEEIEMEIRRLLIEEFGSLQRAKKDIMVANGHLPEKLHDELIGLSKLRYPYIERNQKMCRDCMLELNRGIQKVLLAHFAAA